MRLTLSYKSIFFIFQFLAAKLKPVLMHKYYENLSLGIISICLAHTNLDLLKNK